MRELIEGAAQVYVEAERVVGIYGMGLTQHAHSFENVALFVNMLLLKGNIGREGTGISPVRGHSNVQGQRTVGISEKPELVPLDKLAAQFGFDPPRDKGMNRRGLRGYRLRSGARLLRPRRQLRPCNPRARPDGEGLDDHAPDHADRNQT
jgi:anaerobic selenocysteine-containing dehydrogenase